MNLYLKAAIITFFLFLSGMFLVQQMDSMRFNELQKTVDSEVIELSSTKLSFLFLQVFGEEVEGTAICDTIRSRIDAQSKTASQLINELDESKKNSLLANYDLLKEKYFLKNAELFLYFKQAEKLCGESPLKPVLYFYPDVKECNDCKVQAAILDKVRDECGNMRVFAFPSDIDLEILSLLKAKYNVSIEPSIVINEKTFSGLQTEEKIKQEIQCS